MSRRALFIVVALAITIAAIVTLSGCTNNPTKPTDPIATVTPTPTPTAPQPVIISFTADATKLVPAGLDTILRWDVKGDSTTVCRIDANTPGTALGNVPLGGFAAVRPLVSTTYTLSCTNASGSAVRAVSIIVG